MTTGVGAVYLTIACVAARLDVSGVHVGGVAQAAAAERARRAALRKSVGGLSSDGGDTPSPRAWGTPEKAAEAPDSPDAAVRGLDSVRRLGGAAAGYGDDASSLDAFSSAAPAARSRRRGADAFGAAARLGAKCGCGGADLALRSTSSACGDAMHHVCDAYPCVWERSLGSATPGADGAQAWKDAYVAHVARVKSSVPAERLLVVPVNGAAGSDPSPVGVSRTIAQFAGFAEDPDAFAAAHPFEPHLVDIARERRWSVAVFVLVGALGLAILVVPNPYAGRGRRDEDVKGGFEY